MKHEAKLAIIFIGILGVSFAVLLFKRLSHPGNRSLLSYTSQPVNATSDGAAPAKLSAAFAPPTLVTPKSENSRPPELANDATLGATEAAPSWGQSSRGANQDYGQSNSSYSSPERAGTTATVTAAAPTRASAASADPFHANAATTAQSHQSGYADAGEAMPRTAAVSTNSQQYSTEAPATTSRSPSSADAYRYGYAPTGQAAQAGGGYANSASANWRTDTNTPQPNMPVAGYGYSQQSTSSAAQHPSVFPVASAEPTAAQHYGASTAVSAGTGVTQASGIEKRGDEYTIQPNDSFWNICQKAYGNGAYFKALREYNRKKHPEANDLKVGEALAVPEEAVLRRAYPDLCPKPHRPTATVQQRLASASGRMRENSRVYTVVEGDTLFEIARRELGKPSRWGEVYELNRDVLGSDFDYLKPGLELILPDTRKQTENVTRQPSDFYQR